MKINEIIEPRDIDRPVSTPFNIQRMGKEQDTNIGGAYARGTEDPVDPHMYRKKLRMPANLTNDAYFQYIKACSPLMKSNPYFPRVYEVVFKKYANGYVKPSYNMEKLVPLKEVLNQIGDRVLPVIIGEQIYDENRLERARQRGGLYIGDITRDISDGINNFLNVEETFKDDNLIDAILLIQEVKKSNKYFRTDCHLGNFMVRFGPTGMQLVITDPLEDGGHSIAAGHNPFTGKSVTATNFTAGTQQGTF